MSSRKKILVVDDEPDLRAIARLRLENSGYEVLQAENGRKGIDILKQNPTDMVILDLMMPEMNGIEFCRRMIEDLGMKSTPVLLVSAVNEKAGIVRQFFNLPLEKTAFIAKPVEPEQIIAHVKDLIGEPSEAGAAEPKKATVAAGAEPPRAAKLLSKASSPLPKEEPAPPPPKAATPQGPRLRILVIDDEEGIRMLLKTALGLRHDVETAENGMAALGIIERVNPDFIISDVNMPVMNGLETIEAIRRHPKFGSVPVFFLTAETDSNLPRKTFDLGGNLYLRKPLDPMRLLMIIDRFVEETGLKAKPAPTANGQSGETEKPKPASRGPVRILTIDYNLVSMAKLKNLLGSGTSRGWETLWSEEVRTAVGNLTRWEPDVILYNPRNPGMDGIAFAQTLKLRKLPFKSQIAFIGSSFYDADKEYSRRNFGREVIDMEAPDEVIGSRIFEVIDAASRAVNPKKSPLMEILKEDEAHRRAIKEQRNKVDRQREVFRERFSKLQEFIDKQLVE